MFPRHFLNELHQKIKSIIDLKTAMVSLLDTLRMDQPTKDDNQLMNSFGEASSTARILQIIGKIFGSNIGISTLAESLRQMVLVRYEVFTNYAQIMIRSILHLPSFIYYF